MGQRDNPDFLGMYIKREFDVALGCPFPPPGRDVGQLPMPLENYRIINTALAEDNVASLGMIATPAGEVVTPVLQGLVAGTLPGTRKGITSAIAEGIELARADKDHVFNHGEFGPIARDSVTYVGELLADKMTGREGSGGSPIAKLPDRFVTNSVHFIHFDPLAVKYENYKRDLGDTIPETGIVTITHQGHEESYEVARNRDGQTMLKRAKLQHDKELGSVKAVDVLDRADIAGHPVVYRSEFSRLSVVQQTFAHAAGYAAFAMAPRAFGDPAAADRERQKREQGWAAALD